MKRLAMVVALVAAVLTWAACPATGGYVTVYGGPTFDVLTGTGYRSEGAVGFNRLVNDTGVVVDTASKYVSGINMGVRAMRWDSSGTTATELGNLGTDASGNTGCGVYAVNNAGTAVGDAQKYNTSGTFMGTRAVRWNTSGTDATELGILGTDASGKATSGAYAINNAGTVVGYAWKYAAGTYIGQRAVRWDASGTTATELGSLGTDASGNTVAKAFAINETGCAVGTSYKYVSGTYLGSRAVRWAASGTDATELGNLGTKTSGYTEAIAYAINDIGTAVGYGKKYDADIDKGNRAIRWDASGTDAIELGNLGTDTSGRTQAIAWAINSIGTTVGYGEKYDAGIDKGMRAVRWDASGTTATELGNLGTDSSGYSNLSARSINDAGIAVGRCEKYDASGTSLGYRAVLWNLDGTAIDLNTLIDPASDWTLIEATGISNTGWIEGVAIYNTHILGTPDNPGGATYYRDFLIQVPEPATLALVALGGAATMLRRRK